MRQIKDRLPERASKFHRDAYTDGIESVLYLRCMKHVAHPALNTEEGDGECPVCAIDKLKETHDRETRNMALDAYNEAFVAVINSVKTSGFCSFCGFVISVHNTLKEAQEAMRIHILSCPKMHEALATTNPASAQASLEALKLEIRKQEHDIACEQCRKSLMGGSRWKRCDRGEALASAPAVNEEPEGKR